MDQGDLEIFLHLAGSGSLSASSRMLRMPKSSVSRALARIETDAGVALFERSTRLFRLTDAGTLLRPYAQRVVHDLREARAQLDGIVGEARGLLRVNTTASFAQELIAPMLPVLAERHADLRIELGTDPRTIDMVQEGVDLVVRIGALPDSALIAKRLPPIALLLVASPEYLARRGAPTDLSELVDHDLVTRETTSRWTFHKEDAERTIEVSGRIIIPDAGAQKVVVAGGAGIGCLPDYLASASLEAGSLVHLLPGWRRPPVDIHAVYPSHQGLSAKVRVFIDALTAHLTAR
ncbi:LysR substrate-binding domain-containing protein [uncultured Sphingomonas sp.]|uniref:LysR substrate-binding domain-containing protein n=1 Tax=uncultured Sphingomonas sp. TaxID=158754 RepID=UPI0026193773|nr:LysR substrate-binding domain-containing protein [uncultured Sphingomonas sp.]